MDIRFSGKDSEARLIKKLGLFLDRARVQSNGEISLYIQKNLIASIDDLTVHVYRDHNPPHFHVVSKQREIDAQFTLEDCQLWNDPSGKVKSSDIKKIQTYFKDNPEDLAYMKQEHRRMNS